MFDVGYLHKNYYWIIVAPNKKIKNNSSYLNIEKIKAMFNNDENSIKKYFDGWICYSLCLKIMKNKKFG